MAQTASPAGQSAPNCGHSGSLPLDSLRDLRQMVGPEHDPTLLINSGTTVHRFSP